VHKIFERYCESRVFCLTAPNKDIDEYDGKSALIHIHKTAHNSANKPLLCTRRL